MSQPSQSIENLTYHRLTAELRSLAVLESCASLLGWDEQTCLPDGGTELRADQMALMAGLVHDRATSSAMREMLDELVEADLGPDDGEAAVNVRDARRRFDRATKLPKRLVEEISRVTALAQHAWIQARKASSYTQFQPWLKQVIALKREEAEAVGYEINPYDALLDDYEPGMTAATVGAAFDVLRAGLVELLQQIAESGVRPDVEILTRRYPVDAQRRFAMQAAEKIGFDFTKGRLDEAAHPFCSGMGPGDCRLTTRYDVHHFPGAFFGTLHEAGHGIYEQGLREDAFGLGMGKTISLGIHESQSRMWENLVGRSAPFWDHFFKPAQQAFPEALADVTVDEFYKAVNDVRATFIRVEADEVTYNLHIMLRFSLEQDLLSGVVAVEDLPGVWNERFEHDFGLAVPDDAHGCLQDIHWSAGLFGYFPTYAFGNMYAAQLFAAAEHHLGDLAPQFAAGQFGPLKGWLNENIHQRGCQYWPPQLIEATTGAPPSPEPLLAHLHRKYSAIYGD